MSEHLSTAEPLEMLPAALYYARLGLAVFPLEARGKAPLTRHGVHDATTDASQVRAWWTRWPSANIAIACGGKSGVIVVDIDGDAGDAALFELEREHGALPTVPTSSTGKGRHLWFAFDPRVRNSVRRLPSIDTRSDGGYVVAPPSVHPNGRRYEWLSGRTLVDLEAPPMPEWLVERFLEEPKAPRSPDVARTSDDDHARKYCLAAMQREANELGGEGKGGRNHAANRAAYKLGGYVAAGHLGGDEVFAALFEACRRNGLVAEDGERSVRATISSGLQAGRRHPRDIPESHRERERARREALRDTQPDEAERERARRAILDELHGGDDHGSGSGGGEPPVDDWTPPGDDDLPPDGDSGLPVIRIRTAEREVVDEAIAALGGEPSLYQRGNVLCHVVRDLAASDHLIRPRNAPRILAVANARLRELMASRATWLKWDARRKDEEGNRGDWAPAHPPEWAVSAVAARGEWRGIRPLEAVIEYPVIRRDGTVLYEGGYDERTRLLLEPIGRVDPLPSTPTREHAQNAVDELLDVVQDFPFQTDAHRAAWLAGVLTPFARYAMAGPSPLFLVSANTRGAGKTLLSDVAGIIATGRTMPRTSFDPDDAEMRKRITAIALEGTPLVLLDNIRGTLGSASLDMVLTGTTWQDRILGKNEQTAPLPLYATWWANGNNVVLGADTARRTLHVKLHSPLERPEEREDVHHRDLRSYVERERPRLARAALTILSAYLRAGSPDLALKSWGSFEGWSAVVRSAVVWAGCPDPFYTREALLSQSDSEAVLLAELIDAWHRLYDSESRTVSQVMQDLDAMKGRDGPAAERYELLRGALEELCDGAKNMTAKRIGRRLMAFEGRVIGGRAIECLEGNGRGGRHAWRVRELGTPAQDGSR